MRAQDWELLCILYERKSLSKASEVLFISQPALTRRLKQIEEEMDTIITYRTTKGLTFTPQGEQLVQYARNMLQQYNAIKSSLHVENAVAGTLRLSSSNSLSQFFLPELLQRFNAAYPDASFEVQSYLSHENVHMLNARSTQVSFFCGDYSGAFQRDLLMTHRGYIVSAKPFTMQELPDLPYIAYQTDHFTDDTLEHWWYDWFDCAPYTAITVRNGNICYEMVRRGLGYALFLNTNFWSHNKDLYYMQVFFRDGAPMERRSWIGYRKESLAMANVRAFVDFTRAYAQDQQSRQPVLQTQNF